MCAINKIANIRFTIGDCAGGHRADNREKNRDVLCVPREYSITSLLNNEEKTSTKNDFFSEMFSQQLTTFVHI